MHMKSAVEKCSWALAGAAVFAALFLTQASQAQQPAGQPKPQPRLPAQAVQGPLPPQVQLFIPYKEYSQADNQRILKMYEDLRVADISDGMDGAGLQDIGIVHESIRPLWRDTDNYSHRIVGIAVTARYVPTNKREGVLDQKKINQYYGDVTGEQFMQALFPGSILVIDAMEDGESRSIGSNNIMSWKKLGMVGLVTSGGLADSDEIIAQKVPAYHRRFARGVRPGRNELESVNRPVTIGGALVRPGDVVACDGDGCIVVPREKAEEVATIGMTFLDQIGLERAKQKAGKK
jgi:4-hydroxy-4-methyl-2-oxoglutarate aldolase